MSANTDWNISLYKNDDFNSLVSQIGEFRVRHMPYIIKFDGVYYTWTDLGGDRRIAEWMFGNLVLNGYKPSEIPDVVMDELDKGKVLILDYLQDNYELPSTCDERTWTYLADKCAKTIAFGATWTQVVRYIEKELDYLESHPRNADGRRTSRKVKRDDDDDDYTENNYSG